MEFVLNPFVRDSTGRRGPDLRLSEGRVSAGASGRDITVGGEEMVSMEESAGVNSGVGDWRLISKVDPMGSLCGRGEMSIESL